MHTINTPFRSTAHRKEAIMEKLMKALGVIRRVVNNRLFAAGVMSAVTVVMATMISVHSHAVTVIDGDSSRVVLTMHSDPYKTVEMAGVAMANYDLLRVDAGTGAIAIDRAKTVEVMADGTSTLLYMTDGTVEQALQQASVTLNKYDTMDCALSDPIVDGMAIRVDRVAYEDYAVVEAIPYETETRLTPVLHPGRTKVVKAGAEGSRTLTYRKTIVNGEVVETTLVNEKVNKSATNKIVLKGSNYGTPLSPAPGGIQLDGQNQPVNYKVKYEAKSCTAYGTEKKVQYGASGMKLSAGKIAVNPDIIPYGTKLWITSADGKFVYGYAIAADTGSFARNPNSITFADLYFDTYEECLQFGRRNLNIYVIG